MTMTSFHRDTRQHSPHFPVVTREYYTHTHTHSLERPLVIRYSAAIINWHMEEVAALDITSTILLNAWGVGGAGVHPKSAP